jgi:hypothetical protein
MVFQMVNDKIDRLDTKVDKRMDTIESKVDELLQFKWKIVGGTILASLVLTTLFQIGMALLQRG